MGAETDDNGLPVSLEGLPAAHLRVLLAGLPIFERCGLLLAGGHAFRAHEILHRPSQDLDFATQDDTPLPEIAGHVRNAFQAAGIPRGTGRGDRPLRTLDAVALSENYLDWAGRSSPADR